MTDWAACLVDTLKLRDAAPWTLTVEMLDKAVSSLRCDRNGRVKDKMPLKDVLK
jgi:hypothetical protein